MTNHILYSFRRCPYVMRARLAVYQSGITVELREIVLRDKPAHMLKISPKGTVPVLLTANGEVIDESLDIMHWALKQNDPQRLLENADMDLIKQNDGEFKRALDRYKYPNRYPDEDCTGMFGRGAEILKQWNARISEHGYINGERPSLCDYAIFPFVRQFANVDRQRFDGLSLTALSALLERHLASDLFQSIMEKYDPWQEGDPPLLFSGT